MYSGDCCCGPSTILYTLNSNGSLRRSRLGTPRTRGGHDHGPVNTHTLGPRSRDGRAFAQLNLLYEPVYCDRLII